MIVSIVLTGKYNIGINSNNKIKVNDKLIAINEIPFIRYRFEHYGDEEINFIQRNKEKFKGPVHLVEVTINENVVNELNAISKIENLAKIIYVPVNDDDTTNGLSDEKLDWLKAISDNDFEFDRVMLKDKATMLYALSAEKLKYEVAEALDDIVEPSEIGVCGSPLSFRNSDVEGQACITAIWARAILANHTNNPDMPTPTATHECMDCCGCTKYLIVDRDLPAPLSVKEKSENKKSKETNKDNKEKEVKPKSQKKKIILNADDLLY